MKSRHWQKWMIRLAGSAPLTRWLQGNRWTTGMAQRFVAQGDATALIQTALRLQNEGLRTSIYYLGEYVNQPALIEENVRRLMHIIEVAGQTAPEIFICVDPTQIGYTLSDELGWQNAVRIADVFKAQPNAKFMMIDMEDHTFVERTLDLYCRLKNSGVPVAITLQSYLYRTDTDIEKLAAQGAAIRLCKGAFAEGSDISRTKWADISASYLQHATRLLQPDMKKCGVYPIFATHDDQIIRQLQPILQQNGWQAGEYEFEMLMGVRDDFQRQLVAEGEPVRVYVPFGTEWWAYTARRIGENPANIGFLLRALGRK